jgi:hypothetical protein
MRGDAVGCHGALLVVEDGDVAVLEIDAADSVQQ